jgi:hypothetical protein
VNVPTPAEGQDIRPFDNPALYAALDQKRTALGLSWQRVADQMWEQSAALNGRRRDHPISPSALTNRLRWALKLLYVALDEKRRQEGLTWVALAAALGCSPGQLTGLRTAKYATSMDLAMRITQWLGRPAADFVYPAAWLAPGQTAYTLNLNSTTSPSCMM